MAGGLPRFALRRRLIVFAAAAVVAAGACTSARAATSPEQRLADRYAPVVMLKKQRHFCGRGEPYRPVQVDLILGRKDVSLFRGTKGHYTRLRRAPTARDLYRGASNLYVDLPGQPVTQRCSYQKWFRRIGGSAPNAVYAHVATERGHQGAIALQYWLYYVYNDFNDKHESDWEMIQLDFDAPTVEQALEQPPADVLYSQHEGAERATWNESKLQKVGGTHVVTYPGAGSHANYYRSALWLGRSPGQGYGCDDSTGPSTRVRPEAVVIPDTARADDRFAWVTFKGHWGQRQQGVNNGPTGPNTKPQWKHPFSWAESVEREHSFSVPGTAHAGLDTTDFFCFGVTGASDVLDAVFLSGWAVIGVTALLVIFIVAVVTRTRWRPAPLRPLEQQRAAGQILRVSFGVYRLDWKTLFVVSALVFPLIFLGALGAHLLFNLGSTQDLVQVLGRHTPVFVDAYVLVLVAIEVAGLGIAIGATALVVVSLRLGEERIGTTSAYRLATHRAEPLAGVLLRVAGIPVVLALTIVGLPVAIWYLGRTAVAVPACVIEELDAGASIRRSKEIVGGYVWRVSALTSLTIAVALLVGPLVGAIILLNTDLPILVANLIGMAVSAAALPLAGIVITLLFFDLRTREQQAPEPAPAASAAS